MVIPARSNFWSLTGVLRTVLEADRAGLEVAVEFVEAGEKAAVELERLLLLGRLLELEKFRDELGGGEWVVGLDELLN